ncbi:MAG: superinfection immunity protein [Polynucleobacter sp.]|jgi:ABC-type sugar transport system permease subunit
MRLLFAILITILSLFYFLPFAIAFHRKRANAGAIFALNLFLGWSLIGWVVALVWALKDEQII